MSKTEIDLRHVDSRHSGAGFTLVELMVVTAVLLTLVMIGFPAMQTMVDRGRVLSVARETSTHLQLARQEALRAGVPVVVQADFANDELFIFANVDDDPALEFKPDSAKPSRVTDHEITRLALPEDYDIYFWGPGDKAAEGSDAVVGFTAAGSGDKVAVFQPDGSVRDVGAFRLADTRGNFFEIRIETAATAKTVLRKYNPAPAWGGKAAFFPEGRHTGTDSPLWVWF